MKNLAIIFFFILGTLSSISAQVTSVKYLLEYNDATAVYDFKLAIQSGTAITFPQRVQFNSQISVVIPTGSTIALSEFFNPLEDNQNYTGTIPSVWEMGDGVVAPPAQPESDFYNIFPILSPISSYNNLSSGDSITLFSLDINVNPCENSVRLFENGVDPSSTEMPDQGDYSNGFTLGSINQIYDGNLESTYVGNWTASLPDYEICELACVELVPAMECAPEDLTYVWSTGETSPTITVCPSENTTYSVEINGPNSATNSVSNTVSVIEAPIVSIDGSSEICVSGFTFLTPTSGGNWVSSNNIIATVTNGGVVEGINAGSAIFSFIDTSTGCASEDIEIIVKALPEVMITGSDSICVNGTTTLSPGTGGTWTSSNPVVLTIDNSGNATGFAVGNATLTYTNISTGCASLPSDTVWVLDDPIVEITGDDRLCTGETSSVSPNTGGTWVSNSPSVATIISATGIITGVAQGVTTFTYTDVVTGCTATTTGLIVDPVPSVSTDSDMICITSTANLSPSSGGVWTALNASTASLVGTTVTGISSGDAGFLFTGDATGCVSDTLWINVEPGPTTTLTGPNQICVGSTTTIEPSFGGSWSSTDPNIATVDNFGNITAIGAGCVNFIFTSASTLCASEPSEPVCVNPAPIVSASLTNLCIGETMALSPAFGGTWTSNDSGVATVNVFTGLVTAVSAGTVTFTFTDSSSGCSKTTQEVTVNSKPIVEFTGPDTICVGFTTAISPTSGGTWTSSNFIIATIDNLGNVTGFTPGMTDLIFTDTNTGCSSDPLKVTVLAAAEVSITGDDELCIGETTQLLPSSGGTWTSADASIATVTISGLVQGVGAGVTIFQFTSGIGQCTSEGTDPITVNAVPPTAIIGDSIICVGQSTQLSPTSGGFWECHNPSIATIDNNGLLTSYSAGTITCVWRDNITGCTSNESDPILVEQCMMLTTSCEDINPDNVFCDYNVLSQVEGSLNSEDTPGNQPPNILCDGEAGNIMWLGFIALEGDYEIIINSSSCTPFPGGVPGIQVGLYSSCDFDESNKVFCGLGFEMENQIIISSNVLTAGNVYYMFIDGIHNSTCDFDIDVNGNYDNSYCTDLSKVTGTAYIDTNENGIYDTDETPLRNVMISLFPGNFSVLTNDDGKYIINTPKGGATLTAQVNEGDWVEDFLTLDDVSVLEECVEDINFGFVPSSNSNVSVRLSISNTVVRCDWETRFYITLENTGSEPFEGILEFEFDDEATFFSSPIPNINVNGNKLIATTGLLLPFIPQQYEVNLKMPSGSTNLPILDFKFELKDVTDVQVAEYSYSEQLRCSYDPNDKREYPDREGEDNLTLMDEDIEYTIRFQNNGNDTAFLVKIVDVLDPNIDPTSIRVVNSSHDVETCIEGNNLIFLFEDINLVDSMTNYDASQGFVTFRSRTKEGRAEYTSVYNTADIIFDTNVPIVTNTTLNTLVSVLCTEVTTELDVEICEGDMYEGYTESGVYTSVVPLLFGCDSTITINLDVQDITYSSQDIEICEGASVELNGTTYTLFESQEVSDTVKNTIGCISSVYNYDFSVITTQNIDIDTTICEGMEYEGLEESGTYILESFDPITGCDVFTNIDLEVLPISDPSCLVGIEDIIEAEIKVYPNPANDLVNIEGDSEIESVSIYTIDYSKVKEQTFTNGKIKIQLSTEKLTHGLYFLAIKSSGKLIYKKLIIE